VSGSATSSSPDSEGKRCSGPCGKTKPRAAFSKQTRAKDGLQAWCKQCVKDRQKEIRKPTDPKRQRAFTLKHLYGITVAEWDQMLISQSGLCDLCDDPMKSPHVDHSHATGEVRSLLCLHCNTMLGRVERLGLPRIESYLAPNRISLPMPSQAKSGSGWEAVLHRFLASSYT
jgi:hypothetical protein